MLATSSEILHIHIYSKRHLEVENRKPILYMEKQNSKFDK